MSVHDGRVSSHCPRRRSHLNTNIASVPEALTNQNRKTEAPEKIQAIAAKPEIRSCQEK